MRHMLRTTALSAVLLGSASQAFANTDGFHTVNGYRDAQGQVGFKLTQIGGYGELIVDVQGFGGSKARQAALLRSPLPQSRARTACFR